MQKSFPFFWPVIDNSTYQSRSLKYHNWSLFQTGTEKHVVHCESYYDWDAYGVYDGVFVYLFIPPPPANLLPAAGTKLQWDTSRSMPLLPEFYNINAVVSIYSMQSNLFVGFFEKHTCMS